MDGNRSLKIKNKTNKKNKKKKTPKKRKNLKKKASKNPLNSDRSKKVEIHQIIFWINNDEYFVWL